MGRGKSGTSRICARTSRKKNAAIILPLTLTLDSHALSVGLVVALLGSLAQSHITGTALLPPKPVHSAGCSLTPRTPLTQGSPKHLAPKRQKGQPYLILLLPHILFQPQTIFCSGDSLTLVCSTLPWLKDLLPRLAQALPGSKNARLLGVEPPPACCEPCLGIPCPIWDWSLTSQLLPISSML